jgi:hypothetical protein
MNDDEAIQTAEDFFDQYTLRDEFYDLAPAAPGVVVQFDQQNVRLWVQLVEVQGTALHVHFAVRSEEDAGDPALQALARGAMDALRKAHPELAKYGLTHELFS